ncbi:MAG TPA: hypothetical protein VFF43_02910, partial [Caldimonas sp.]|nr:hypothetical protein [Caldimonas sp.]
SIVGFGGLGMESIAAMSQGGGGHAIAGVIGGALLWAIAASLVGQVYLLGLSIVYLRVTEGLDLTSAEEAFRATLDDAKRRTAELGERARQATQRGGEASAGAAAAAAGGAAASAAAPAFGAPPAFTAAPSANTREPLERDSSEQTTLPSTRPADPDIALPFDDLPGVTEPTTGVQSDWTPLPPQPSPPAPAPSAAPLPAPAPLPPATTCPQCLSAVASEDTFCGVCGYRLK